MTVIPFAGKGYDVSVDEEALQLADQVVQNLMTRFSRRDVQVLVPPPREQNVAIQPQNGMYAHNHGELFIQLHGSTIFHLLGSALVVEAGQLALIPSFVYHGESARFSCAGQFHNLVFMVGNGEVGMHFATADHKGNIYISSNRFYFHYHLSDCSMEYLEAAVRRYPSHKPESGPIIESASHVFLGLLGDLIRDKAFARWGKHSKAIRCRFLIWEYLADSNLSVKMLAELCECTPNYLSMVFRREVGIKITEFINEERLKKAEEFLRNGTYAIAEVSWLCGFENPNYLSKLFKQKYKLTPREFRNQFGRKKLV